MSELGGRSRAKVGAMRRLLMVAIRATARHVLRGLVLVGPSCIHQHNARRAAEEEAAQDDAFGRNPGGPGPAPTLNPSIAA